ncbi:MAG: NAD-glutamate dehydrogenase [Gammaproteobacteria bacterium]
MSIDQKQAVLADLQAKARARLGGDSGEAMAAFIPEYFNPVPMDVFLEKRPTDLFAQAFNHRELLLQHEPGTHHVRVFNPRADEDGWESVHTIVQLVVDDMPFLVDSVGMALNRNGLTIHQAIYPRIDAADEKGGARILMHCEVARRTDNGFLDELEKEIGDVLDDVRAACSDWRAMKERLGEVMGDLEACAPDVPAEHLAETIEFLGWIRDNHFTFLGYREYVLRDGESGMALHAVEGSELGTARRRSRHEVSETFTALPEDVKELFREPDPLILTKTKVRSTVHRPVHLDYVGIKRFDTDGRVVGEHRFLGLYTAAFYNRGPRDVPLVRRKIQDVLASTRLRPGSHDGKTLLNILDTYPRDELLQISADELHRNAVVILHLGQRQRLRLFLRQEIFGRFITALVYIPRERFSTEIRQRMQKLLLDQLDGVSSEFRVSLNESAFAQVYFTVHTPPGHLADVQPERLEKQLAEITRTWADDLNEAIAEHHGEERGSVLATRYLNAFPAGYRDDFDARAAVRDIEHVERVLAGKSLDLALYRLMEDRGGTLRFKLFAADQPLALSDVLPVLENMGVRVLGERPYRISTDSGLNAVYMHDFLLSRQENGDMASGAVRERFQETFSRVWAGDAENDGFNRLVLRAGLNWREIALLRSFAKYLRQTRLTFSQAYMEDTLAAHPRITQTLVALFHSRFDPGCDRRGDGSSADHDHLVAEVGQALDAVESLDADRILRAFLALLGAVLRTNFYQRDGDDRPKPYIALKFDPAQVPDLPKPLPAFEIFVCSPRVEGVHLRGGKVARGGLRWSDRREDFRTEILGLVKAQMVKNSIIVPMGAKGGFVLKNPPEDGSREALVDEAIACYRIFISGLLDITDNLVGGAVAPPPDVVRVDGDDPYLVVAADKGTATFSDIANAVAADYGFWLGDAFASGGAHGYDHKKMGITARGAWESVKRHFRELGTDIQNQEFTAFGVGDMSGDVFGNGMLLSRHIRLIAAFDHRDIFIDPDPDAERSFVERERLFRLPRSSWKDYDAKLISKGGGVFPRSAKSITLTAEAAAVLGCEARAYAPNALIREILKAPLDLFWNGGIGTYIKASDESDASVGDRANDPVRIDAREMQCQVVGEGGNLGLTQRGRIEFALQGGRINTDSIDNAGGVNCSDHEVNIKILLDAVVANGDLTVKQRNTLLEDMTDAVAEHVVQENYWQTGAISFMAHKAPELLEEHTQFIKDFESSGRLNRAIEYLPGDEAIEERRARGLGLTRPELSVLIAYAKNAIYESLLESSAPEDPFLKRELMRYFPTALRADYRDAMEEHRLRRELIALYITNRMVNRLGATFAFRLREQYGFSLEAIAMAYLTAWEIFDLREVWQEVSDLDNRVDGATQIELYVAAVRLVHRATRWLLRHHASPLSIEETSRIYTPCAETLLTTIDELVTEKQKAILDERTQALSAAGVPETLARRICALGLIYGSLAIRYIAREMDAEDCAVGRVYFQLSESLSINWLRQRIAGTGTGDRWEENARMALSEDLEGLHTELVVDVVKGHGDAPDPVNAWLEGRGAPLERYRQIITALDGCETLDVAKISVAVRSLRNLSGGGN